MHGWSSPWTDSSIADPRMPSWAGGPTGVRGGESSTSGRLPGPCCAPCARRICYQLRLSLPACGHMGRQEAPSSHGLSHFVSQHIPTVRPGQEPVQRRFLGPNQQTLLWTEKDAVPSACAPTASPSFPHLPPLARLSPLPVLAGLWMRSLGVPMPAEVRYNPAEQHGHSTSGL